MKSGSISVMRKHALISGLFLGLIVLAGQLAGAQTFSVIHNFGDATDGVNPFAGLAIDGAGNLYGVTWGGGSSGAGTVF